MEKSKIVVVNKTFMFYTGTTPRFFCPASQVTEVSLSKHKDTYQLLIKSHYIGFIHVTSDKDEIGNLIADINLFTDFELTNF